MVEERRFDSMSLDQLREVAVKKSIPGASKLNTQEVLRLLRRLHELEAMPQTKLLTSLKEYRIKGISRTPKRHLVLIALQADRLEQARVTDLRILARKQDLNDVDRLKKKEIVKQLLDFFAESLKSEPLPVDRRLPIPERYSSLARLPLKRWLGRAIQLSSAVGIILSLVSIALAPILAFQVSKWIDGMMLAISQETTMAADSIRQLSLTLDEGVHILEAAEISIRSIENSVQNSEPLIGSTAELLGEHAPKIIDDTRNALISAEEGARAIDQVLRSLARLGPLTGVSYAPERPLNEGISEVTESLEPLPAALRKVGDELSQAGSSLEEVRISLDKMGDELKSFAEEISGKNFILANLVKDLDILSGETDNVRGMIGPAVVIGIIILELLFIGYALGQSAIFYVGRNMTPREKTRKRVRPAS